MKNILKYSILPISVMSFWLVFTITAYCYYDKQIAFCDFMSFDILLHNNHITLAIILSLVISFSLMLILLRVHSGKELNFANDIINRSNDAIFLIDANSGLITYTNSQALTVLDVPADEITNKKFADIDPVAGNYEWQDYLNKIRHKGHFLYETMYHGHNGTQFPVETNIIFVMQGKRPCLLAICRNITERKQAQEWHQTIIRTAKDAFFVTDSNGRFLKVNEAFCHMTGRQQKELLQLGIGDVFDSQEEIERQLLKIFLSGAGTFNCGIRSKDGPIIHLEASANYLASDGGRYFAFLRDITERREMQEALSAEKERLAVTLRSIGDGVIATDTKGQVILMNLAAEKITGWTHKEALILPVSEVLQVIEAKSGKRLANPVDQVMEKGEPVSLPLDSVLITKTKARRIIEISGAPIIDHHNQIIGVVMVFQDKTTERHIEQELLKIEKLSSLSILAGGIAHDFNNILGVILGNVTLAKVLLSKGHNDLMPVLNEAEQASLRAKDLSQQLLTFARGGSPVKELANIAPIIKESAKFACTGSPVRCEVDLPENLWPTEIDPGQISQVIHNLVINAIQAMSEGGVVRIKGENVTLNGKTKSTLPLSHGKYIMILVEDEGVGIWPDQLPKIFDPYFTTKDKGSGLGLATVYSILHNHAGYITVDSIPTQGTTFTLYLPAYKMKVAHQEQVQETLHEGTGKVLVMDDEAMIRANMGEILGLLGYSADLAEDGAKAIELYKHAKEAGEPYEVVITDLTIPGGMGGKETIQKLQELDPQVKAIVFSGYADDPIMSRHAEFGFKGFIKKPYTINDVSESLHRVLSENWVTETLTLSG